MGGERLHAGQGALRRCAERLLLCRQQPEAEAHDTGLVGLEIGAPVIVGEPGEEGGVLARDAAVRIAETAEGEAADLPERRVGTGDGHLVGAVGDADEALCGDVVAAGIGQLLVVELDHGTAGLVVDVPARLQRGGQRQVEGVGLGRLQLGDHSFDLEGRIVGQQAIDHLHLVAIGEGEGLGDFGAATQDRFASRGHGRRHIPLRLPVEAPGLVPVGRFKLHHVEHVGTDAAGDAFEHRYAEPEVFRRSAGIFHPVALERGHPARLLVEDEGYPPIGEHAVLGG